MIAWYLSLELVWLAPEGTQNSELNFVCFYVLRIRVRLFNLAKWSKLTLGQRLPKY